MMETIGALGALAAFLLLAGLGCAVVAALLDWLWRRRWRYWVYV